MTLLEHLTVVEKIRSEINQRHDLIDVMFLVLSGIMSGAEGWKDIENYGDSKLAWLRQFRPFEHGIPRRHTIAQILRTVVAESLLEALLNWVNEQRSNTGKPVISFDGKVLRGSYRNDSKTALQLVTAYDTENGLVLSQKPTETKNGEISVVRQMLDVLNQKGSVITLDALLCQRKTLEKSVIKRLMLLFRSKRTNPRFGRQFSRSFRLFSMRKKRKSSPKSNKKPMAAKKSATSFN